MSDPFENVEYDKPFLKEVVARVDIIGPHTIFDTEIPTSLFELAVKNFPIPERLMAVAREVQIGPTGVPETKDEQITEWQFHGKEREKKLVINRRTVLVQYLKYKKYEFLKSDFITILDEIAKLFPGTQSSRVGLRYINSINLEEPNPTDWSSYIAKELLSLFSFPPETDRGKVSRVFHTLELAYDTFNLRCMLGMPNPDYPAQIRQKVFIIDLDAYTQYATGLREIAPLLDTFHSAIQSYFERAITDDLRGKMHARRQQ